MEGSGHLHAPAILLLRKEISLPTEQEVGLATALSW
jgi:hypothetical protein